MSLEETADVDVGDQDETNTPIAGQKDAPAKKERSTATFDIAARTVTVFGPDGQQTAVWSLDGIPEDTRTCLALIGLHAATRNAKNPAALVENMRNGIMPGRAPAKAKERDPRRAAYAHAKVELTKRSADPLTLERALELADALTPAQVKEAMLNPTVVKHHARLTNKAGELLF